MISILNEAQEMFGYIPFSSRTHFEGNWGSLNGDFGIVTFYSRLASFPLGSTKSACAWGPLASEGQWTNPRKAQREFGHQ